MIDVDHHHRQVRVVSAALVNQRRQLLIEQPAIEQAGKRIARRLLRNDPMTHLNASVRPATRCDISAFSFAMPASHERKL